MNTMAKMSDFMIALVIVGMVSSIFLLYFSSISESYSVSYDNDSIAVYNSLSSMSNITRDIRDKEENVTVDSNVFDLLGSFFNRGYQMLRITKSSVNVFDAMSNNAINSLGLGSSGSIIIAGVTVIVLIIIFIGIIGSSIVKREL